MVQKTLLIKNHKSREFFVSGFNPLGVIVEFHHEIYVSIKIQLYVCKRVLFPAVTLLRTATVLPSLRRTFQFALLIGGTQRSERVQTFAKPARLLSFISTLLLFLWQGAYHSAHARYFISRVLLRQFLVRRVISSTDYERTTKSR
jgi:hypothetical protein